MNFLCSHLATDNYYAQFYLPTPMKNLTSIHHYQINQQERRQNRRAYIRIGSNNLTIIPPNHNAPVQRMQSAITIVSLRSLPLIQSSHQRQYLLVQIRNFQKADIAELLKYKQKMTSKENQAKESPVVRMIIKSNYQAIALSSEYNSNKKWQDKQFPPYQIYNSPITSQKIQLQWKSVDSLSIMMNLQLSFMHLPNSAYEINQGSIVGDCYFLSVVAALTRKTQRVEKLFPVMQSNNGIYMARIMFKGILQEVIIDDMFPVVKGTKNLLGCKPSKNQNQIYVMVLQKCWAKLWKSYEAIDGGFPHEALHALSGALTKNYIIQNETSNKERKQSFFKQVFDFSRLQYVMCTGTDHNQHRIIRISQNINIKITPSHCYCIENVYEDNGMSMVKIYNPWGFNKNQKDIDIPGDFHLTWEQYIANFQYLAVAKVRDSANYLFTELKSCRINEFTFVELNIWTRVNGYYAITVSQTDKKQNSLKDTYLTVTYIILRCNKDPNTQIQTYQLKTIRSQYQYCDHYLELADMMEGSYLICIYFTNADEIKQNITFGVYSQDKFGFKQLTLQKQMHIQIIEKALISYDYTFPSERAALTNRKDAWYSFNVMINNSIFGYILLHTGSNQKEKAQIQAGGKAFKQSHLTVMKPYDAGEVLITAQPGHETIAIIRIDNLSQYRQRENQYLKLGKHLHKERIQIKEFK